MNVSVTSAPARTDATTAAVDGSGERLPLEAVRRHGLAVAAGAAVYSAASFAYGFTPDSSFGITVTDLAGFTFQLGVLSLVQLQLETRATGLSRKAAGFLKVERVLLGLAMVWSLVHGLVPSARDDAWLVALDAFWPLSMLGMFAIGVKIAFAGRWRGVARFYPMVAESWAVVSIPSIVVLGATAGELVAAAHFLVGYLTLGLIIAARPQLVVPEQR
ncbi:MAG TPA: hypothetical protein VFG72_05515 [Marmoricola sp.]|nr:hypothetical protein [Marmoricola sp.]